MERRRSADRSCRTCSPIATPADAVLETPRVGEVAVSVPYAKVAGVIPAVRAEGGRGGFGIAVVAGHHVARIGRADHDLAPLARRALLIVGIDDLGLEAPGRRHADGAVFPPHL